LAPGCYLMQLTQDNGQKSTHKLIVQQWW
jgi:hypothetical protein